VEYKCSSCSTPITKNSDSGKCRICSQQKVPFQRLYNRLLGSARRKNQKVDLTHTEFVEFTRIPCCHYCGKKLTWTKFGGKGYQGYNLDRVFPEEPYSIENCVVCCWTCNEARGSRFSYVEFCKLKDGLEIIRKVREKDNGEYA